MYSFIHYSYLQTTDIAKLVSEAWKALTPDEKTRWEAEAQKDKARYEVEKSMYQGPWKVPANKRTPKDPSAPKRPMSAFLAYSNKLRAGLKKLNPKATNSDLSKMLSVTWKSLPDADRQRFMEEESALRALYKVEMERWRKQNIEDKKAERQEREALARQTAEAQQLVIGGSAMEHAASLQQQQQQQGMLAAAQKQQQAQQLQLQAQQPSHNLAALQQQFLASRGMSSNVSDSQQQQLMTAQGMGDQQLMAARGLGNESQQQLMSGDSHQQLMTAQGMSGDPSLQSAEGSLSGNEQGVGGDDFKAEQPQDAQAPSQAGMYGINSMGMSAGQSPLSMQLNPSMFGGNSFLASQYGVNAAQFQQMQLQQLLGKLSGVFGGMPLY
jgi:hypothetical protein